VSEALLVQPDARFIREVMASGGKDLKKCMQCGTCSVVCSLAPDDAAFPRKQMFEAQWGLKDKLVGDPAIWLCHNCGDCSTHCPRGARPGDVFGALRQQAIEHFSYPRLIGRAMGTPKGLLMLFLAASLILVAVALWSPKPGETQAPEFASVFPIPVLEALFFAVAGIVLVGFSVGMVRFVRALKESGNGEIVPAGLAAAFLEIMTHERFSKCEENKGRRLGHLLVFWGFVALALMGTAVGIGTMVGSMRTPLALTSPWKIFANGAAAVIMVGCVILLTDRIRDPVKRRSSTYFDWFFLLTLTGVALTGVLAELLRLGEAARIMYGVYFIHLTLILILFLSAPYSKFAHLLYRTVALAAMKAAESREKSIGCRPTVEAGAN
jgi:quinone-modifying oxidoreductase subunit QmoC